MLQKIKDIIMFNVDSALMLLRTPTPLIWAMPFITGIAFWLFSLTPVAVVFSKPVQEVVAICILSISLAVILFAHVKLRKLVTLWLVLFGISVLCREIHFYGTHRTFYLALLLLVIWFAFKRVRMVEDFQAVGGAKYLAGAFWTYCIAKVMDRDYLEFMPNYWEWNNYVEESMESVGHLMVLTTSIIIFMTWKKSVSHTEDTT